MYVICIKKYDVIELINVCRHCKKLAKFSEKSNLNTSLFGIHSRKKIVFLNLGSRLIIPIHISFLRNISDLNYFYIYLHIYNFFLWYE